MGRTRLFDHPQWQVSTLHVSVDPGLHSDNILCRFWEIEENPGHDSYYTPEEHSVMKKFEETLSDIAKTFDILGCLPTIIQVKILLQQVWEAKV